MENSANIQNNKEYVKHLEQENLALKKLIEIKDKEIDELEDELEDMLPDPSNGNEPCECDCSICSKCEY